MRGGIRQRVVQKLEKSFKHSDPIHQREIWEKSLVSYGPRLGSQCPASSSCRLTRYVLWTMEVANSFSCITEKLQVPTADLVVSTIRTLASSYSGKFGAWIVDERSAFRQLPVAPESRAVAVVVLCAPGKGRVAYFMMYCHPFGLSPSVYNYNRPDDRQELFRPPLWGQPAGAATFATC